MNFLHISERPGSAAVNMAHDFLLLRRFPEPDAIRFRHYQWQAPAFTFGYSQRYAFVSDSLPVTDTEICRRPTGGGVVDHREDWTYALVIPPNHFLYGSPAPDSYRFLHEVIRDQFLSQGQPAALQSCPPRKIPPEQGGKTPPTLAEVCFARAEPFDVIHDKTGEKLAGAAQKRTRQGLLFQGSISRPGFPPDFDWKTFAEEFPARLASRLEGNLAPSPWPDFDPGEETALIDQFASEEWLRKR